MVFAAERSGSTVASREFTFARDVAHDKVEISLDFAESFVEGDEVVLQQGDNSESLTISAIEEAADGLVIQFARDLTNNYSADSSQPAMLTKNVQDGDPIVVPLLKDAERNAIVLPLDRAQGALESGDQIVVQGMGGKSEIVIVDTVQTDLTNNEAVVLLRTPLQELSLIHI